MDLKTAQRELKNDILHHQALIQQLKKDPLNTALKLKLKAVQQHIVELGSKQKKVFRYNNIKMVNSEAKPVTAEKSSQSKAEQSNPENKPLPSYTLVAIQKESNPLNRDHGSPIGDNLPINLTIKSTKLESALVPTTALLVVTSSSGQNNSNASQTFSATTTAPMSISLSSLVSTGGVVTLAGGWKTATGCVNSNAVTDISNNSKLISGTPLQIKVPVMQNPGSNSVILLPQNSVNNNQSKSLLRLLPKGHQAIGQVRHTVVNGGQQHVATTSTNHSSSPRSNNTLSTLLLTSTESRTKAQPYQPVVVQRVIGGNPSLTSQATSSNVMWKDLSSKTPAVHKPSYVPRKSFANMNNGVGSFQKFRILGGKAQILPKTSSQMAATSSGPQISQKTSMNAVLTSTSKPSSSGIVAVTRLVPASVSRTGFYPIQPQNGAALQSTSRNHSVLNSQQLWKRNSVGDSGVPTSSFRPVSDTCISKSNNFVKEEQLPGRSSGVAENNQEHWRKTEFLRNLDLVTTEQAYKVRNRRFRKRRVAANPVYSGGMYISNELEPKRQCTSSIMLGGLDCITPPDVIVKRPRGRPRGSTKANSIASVKQASKNVRTNLTPSTSAACMNELRQLRGILDVVASASKAVSSAAFVKKEISPPSTEDLCSSPQDTHTGDVSSKGVDVIIPDAKDDEIEDGHEDQCACCGRTGEVLMCDTCSRVYHLGCTSPPLSSIPTGMWICSKCRTEFKATRSRAPWSGIVATVHSYVEHDCKRETAIEEEKKKLSLSKKLVMGLQLQTKSLTSTVMSNVSLRSKAKREKQVVLEDIVALRNLVKKIRDQVLKGVGEADK